MTDSDKSRHELLAEVASLRQQLSTEKSRRSRELEHIQHVLQAVNSTLDLDQVVDRVTEALEDIFDFNQVSIYIFNARNNCLEITDWYGEDASDEIMARFVEFPLSIDWEEVHFVKAFLDNEPKYVSPITPKLLTYYSERDRQMFNWNPHHSIAIFPLQVQEKVIGIINFVHTRQPFSLVQAEIDHIQRYVAHIASTINNAYLVRKTRYALQVSEENQREVAHLNEVIQMTNATLDFDEVFGAISDGLKDIFEFEAVGIQLLDETDQLLNVFKVYGDVINQQEIDQWRKIQIPVHDKDSVSSYVFHTAEPFYFAAVGPDAPLSEIDQQIYNVHPFSAYLSYPLKVRQHLIGVISFFRTEQHFELDESELARIQRYVDAISSAINNANTYEQLKTAYETLSEALSASDDKGSGEGNDESIRATLEKLRHITF